MMGAAIGSSPAGKDLYEALDRWLYRLPGGLAISNIGACAIFAALTGSSPAYCAAIGKMGIPEMRRRGYPDEVATGSICAGGTLGILILRGRHARHPHPAVGHFHSLWHRH
jgi:C4-dicarboxylate transporter, DctM subunit